MTDDHQLLERFATGDDEDAFRELIERHLDLVYSAALRRVNGDASLAEDVAQTVFTDLARKARSLPRDVLLTGWLYEAARLAAGSAIRGERRRRAREQEAMTMQHLASESRPGWEQLAPVLDDAMGDLCAADRNAILLRYFKNHDFHAVGLALGVSDDTAQKRVSRAVERLREFFAKRGVTVGAQGLVVVISANAVQAAPAGLAGTLATAAVLAETTLTTTATATAAKAMAMTALQKTLIAAALVAAVGAGIYAVLDSKERQPDPVELLKTVAQARSRIASGEMEFEFAQYHFALPLDGTNQVLLKVVFDGKKRRSESSDRQYTYVLMGPHAAEVTDAKRRELGLDREASVRAGLLTGSEHHHITAYDGAVLMDYWAKDGKPFQTRIADPEKGSSTYVFDPRALGLTPSPSVMDTVENCLVHESVQLVGKESVDGADAWHVRAPRFKSGDAYDYWIDAKNPSRVVKQEFNGNTVFSKYNPTDANDPIPIEVRTVRFYGARRSRVDTHFLRRNARFNIPINPVSWTLAGLHMPVGTDVVDDRISRSIGWWDGSRLSNNRPPSTPQIKPKSPPNLSKLLELAAKDPKSAFAAHACFTVATHLKRDANEGSDERATIEAEELFERITTDFGEMEWEGMKLADRVKPELSELRRLGIGKVAPEIEGDDLDGNRMKLSDYRGKVVVLSFWGTWCGPCIQRVPEERKLIERMTGKPFALIGINSDEDQAKVRAVVEKEKINWPSFRDGTRPGPVATAWNIRSWPTIYVLDAQGVIRYRNVQDQALADAVDALVPERK